jgi:hypothetical protein
MFPLLRNHPVFASRPSRRRFLSHVSAGCMGLGLADLLTLEAFAEQSGGRTRRAKQVLVVYEEGGISQMDTWDPKPTAPIDHRTPYKPIATNVPGISFSELMPQLARHADKLSIVRSMTSTSVAGHMEGCQEFFKGYPFNLAKEFPDIGSVVAELMGSDCAQLPPYLFCPGANMPNHVTSTGFLSVSRAPWKLGTKSLGENVADPKWKVRALEPQSGLSTTRLADRRRLLGELSPESSEGLGASVRRTYGHAFDLLTSPKVQAAFDLSNESDAVRDRYGRDHRGCCYLLGRKLIETGVRFVTVTVIQPPELVGRPGYGEENGVFLNWDHHEGIYRNGPCGGPQGMSKQERYGLPHPAMMPSLDRSLSALLEDLQQRGLLEETLVCFITEMGRTPKVNKWQGRDHWARAMSIAFAGAGVPGGQVIGATDEQGGDVVKDLYTPYDYAASVYAKLGIGSELRLTRPDGRPVDPTFGGTPIPGLF